jgi:hypothetical protein
MMRRKFFAMAAIVSASILMFTACSKSDDDDNPDNKATISMRLTDGPGDYDAIYLDIESVEVTMSGSSAMTLNPVRAGLYDILKFRNGLDTLLVQAEVPAGTVQQIRLKLGNNSVIVVDGTTYPLSTPSGQQSGIKLNLNETFVADGSYTIWLDFDAAKSINQTGNGQYKLKPVIRAYSALTDGRIKGYVLPFAALTTVYAINGVDTFAAIPNALDGYYRISGLPAGTYQVWFDADDLTPYQDHMITNVQVSYGVETELPSVTLLP